MAEPLPIDIVERVGETLRARRRSVPAPHRALQVCLWASSLATGVLVVTFSFPAWQAWRALLDPLANLFHFLSPTVLL